MKVSRLIKKEKFLTSNPIKDIRHNPAYILSTINVARVLEKQNKK